MDNDVLKEILKRTIEDKLELIHEDERGKIWRLEIDGQEYILLYTVKNEVRGGDYHKTRQHDYILKGQILWTEKTCLTCPEGKGEKITVLKEGQEITTKPNVPHMMISFGGPSLVLEWHDGPFEKQYYRPYRDKIEGKTE